VLVCRRLVTTWRLSKHTILACYTTVYRQHDVLQLCCSCWPATSRLCHDCLATYKHSYSASGDTSIHQLKRTVGKLQAVLAPWICLHPCQAESGQQNLLLILFACWGSTEFGAQAQVVVLMTAHEYISLVTPHKYIQTHQIWCLINTAITKFCLISTT
jgi:hypothetical protein